MCNDDHTDQLAQFAFDLVYTSHMAIYQALQSSASLGSCFWINRNACIMSVFMLQSNSQARPLAIRALRPLQARRRQLRSMPRSRL